MPDIETLGGLRKPAIELLIARSEQKTAKEYGDMLDRKLGELKTSISDRMDTHEENVKTRLDKQDGVMAEVLSVVKGSKADLLAITESGKVRDDRLGKIEITMKSLRGWLSALKAVSSLRTASQKVVLEGRPYLVTIAAVMSSIVATVQFIHTVWPVYVAPWLQHHHLMR
jgi:hypothetical protein